MEQHHTQLSQQWVCGVCGYIYDPDLHDGVAFEDVPDDWTCPGCGFGKRMFRRCPRRATGAD